MAVSREPAPAPAQTVEKKPRDQAHPCGTAPAPAAVSARSSDDVRKAHTWHIKLGLDRYPRHARPLPAACALSGWPDSYTFPFVLKACAQLVALQEGRQVTASARAQPSSVLFCNR